MISIKMSLAFQHHKSYMKIAPSCYRELQRKRQLLPETLGLRICNNDIARRWSWSLLHFKQFFHSASRPWHSPVSPPSRLATPLSSPLGPAKAGTASLSCLLPSPGYITGPVPCHTAKLISQALHCALSSSLVHPDASLTSLLNVK